MFLSLENNINYVLINTDKGIDVTKDVESLIEKELRYAEAEFYYIKRLEKEVSERNLSKVRSLVRTLGRIERRLNKSHKKVKSAINTLNETGKGSEKLDIVETKLDVFEKEGIKSLSKQAGILPKLVKKDEPDWEEIAKEVVRIKKVIIALAELERELLDQVTQQQLPNRDPNQEVYLQKRTPLKLNKYIERGKKQTELLKSIPYFKYWYEKSPSVFYRVGIFGEGWTWSSSSSKLLEVMHKEAHKLYTVFTKDELEKLLRVRSIPLGATILIFEQLKRPIVAYNLEYLPQNVEGWVSHSMPGENLKMVAGDGEICYNIEVLRRRKTLFSSKYEIDPTEKRIKDGVSCAYQTVKRYISYARDQSPGGVWIFPISEILNRDLILDFRNTTDNQSGNREVVLRNKVFYSGDVTILRELERAIKKFSKWEEQLTLATKTFNSSEDITKIAGKPWFREEEISNLIKFRTENKFFAFAFLFIDGWKYSSPKQYIPSLYTFAKGKSPVYLNSTFLKDVNSYYIPGMGQHHIMANYVILQLLSEDKHKRDLENYANVLERLTPKEFVKLLARTKRSLIQTLNTVLQYAQEGITPACIDITKGVLLLDIQYLDYKTLQKLVEKKIPIFTLLPDFLEVQTENFVDWFVSEVLEFQKRKENVSINDYFSKEGDEVILRTE